MGNGKNNVLFIFLTVVVFLVLGAINSLLAHNFNQRHGSQRTKLGEITNKLANNESKRTKAIEEYDKYIKDARDKQLQISELSHQLDLAKVTNKEMVARVDYRDTLVNSIREMTTNLASARDSLVSFFQDKKETENEAFRNELDDLTTKVGTLQTKRNDLEGIIEGLDKKYSKEITLLQTKVNQLKQDIQNTQNIKGVTSVEEEADGKILVVDSIRDFVIINAGAKNGIKPGQRFKVYHLNKNRVPIEKGFVICRTIHDYLSYAQIVNRADKANPILEGDFISSPIYSRNQQIKIVVVGEIRGYKAVDDESRAFLLKKLKRDIEEYGAIFSEDVTPDCVFCVVANSTAKKPDEGETSPDVEKFRRAKEFEIPIIFEDEFIRYIAN